MTPSEPNQALQFKAIGLSTALISIGIVRIVIIGVGVSGPA
jgi:hypothetical protein